MLPRERLDRIEIAFDDHRLVANAGLILPVTLAHRLGLSELVDPLGAEGTLRIVDLTDIRPQPARSLVPHPRLTAAAVSLRWIRA